MKKRIEDWDIQLELKERMPYIQILLASHLNLKNVLRNKLSTQQDINQAIYDYYTDIPDSWVDKEFKEDLVKMVTSKIVDNRPMRSGKRLSVEFCVRHKIEPVAEKKFIDFFKLKNAIVNLLDRRNMLIRREKIEMTTGKNLDIETLDDLPKWDEEMDEPEVTENGKEQP